MPELTRARAHGLDRAAAGIAALVLLACTGGNGEDAPEAVSSPTPPADGPATLTLHAVADTTIYAEAGDRSNGAGDSIFAGGNNDGFRRRALVRFDLAAVPPGAVVASATLTLTLDRTAVGPRPVTVHRLLASWDPRFSIRPAAISCSYQPTAFCCQHSSVRSTSPAGSASSRSRVLPGTSSTS